MKNALESIGYIGQVRWKNELKDSNIEVFQVENKREVILFWNEKTPWEFTDAIRGANRTFSGYTIRREKRAEHMFKKI